MPKQDHEGNGEEKPYPNIKSFLRSKPALMLASALNWPRQAIRRMYDWVVGWAESKNAERALGGITFAESSFFPIPPDPLLIAMTTVKPKKYLRFATICTVSSVLGGLMGYLIGVGLFETVGIWVIETYQLHAEFAIAGERYEENAFLFIFTAAFTPIPYKLITISAGVFHVNVLIFIIASIIGRGGRFFAVAIAMHHFGKRYKDKIEKYIDILSLLFVILIVLGFAAVRYVF